MGGTYDLLPDMGTRKYMAPEVALAKPYNLFADVYSFSIILYEMCSLERLWDDYSLLKHEELVITGKERPLIHTDWSPSIKDLIESSWADAWYMRPSFADIHSVLQREIIMPQNDKNTQLKFKRMSLTFETQSDQSNQFTDTNEYEAARMSASSEMELDQVSQFTDINLHEVATCQRELDQQNEFTGGNFHGIKTISVPCIGNLISQNTF